MRPGELPNGAIMGFLDDSFFGLSLRIAQNGGNFNVTACVANGYFLSEEIELDVLLERLKSRAITMSPSS